MYFVFSEQIDDIMIANFIRILFIKSASFYLAYNGMGYAGHNLIYDLLQKMRVLRHYFKI